MVERPKSLIGVKLGGDLVLLMIIFIVDSSDDYIVDKSTATWQKIVGKKAHHNFPGLMLTRSNGFFHPANHFSSNLLMGEGHRIWFTSFSLSPNSPLCFSTHLFELSFNSAPVCHAHLRSGISNNSVKSGQRKPVAPGEQSTYLRVIPAKWPSRGTVSWQLYECA